MFREYRYLYKGKHIAERGYEGACKNHGGLTR